MSDEQRRYPTSAEIARLFEKVDWVDVSQRLLIFTQRRLKYFQVPPKGRTPEDYVQEAVSLALEGRRVIPPEAAYAPIEFFSAVIDSLIDHDREWARRGPQIPVDEIDVADGRANFENAIAAQEEAERFIASLESELEAYARLRLSDRYSNAEEYATALNMTVQQVRNLERRLARRAGVFRRTSK